MMKQFARNLYYIFRPYIPIQYRWKIQEIIANRKNGFYTQPMWPIPEMPLFDKDFKNHFKEKLPLPFVLTHDVDTQYGFDNILEVAKVEKKLGFKSSWNIVPDLYKINYKMIEELKGMGMEVGVHDWNHDGKLFSNHKVFSERIGLINDVISLWKAKGFRAGMVFHNDEWMQEINCEYDSSYYDTDPFQPLGGGCSYITPFLLGRIIEIPYTMPQDHVLFVARAKIRIPKMNQMVNVYRDNVTCWIREFANKNNMILQKQNDSEIVIEGVDIWKMKLKWLIEKRGMVVMITHPDYLCNRSLCPKYSCGFFSDDDKNILSVRKMKIYNAKWENSLLEQYAAFLNWANSNFGKILENCLPVELYDKFVELKS
jgi:hypothetical protein